jgi:Uma2 family endonuclease
MAQAPLTVRRWTRAEYDRLVDRGVFEGPLELIGGQLLVAEPQGASHASAVGRVGDAIRAALPPGFVVRVRLPLALDDESEPEPDVAVVAGSHDDYRTAHPRRAALLVEIADSSLGFDRETTGSLYARAGVQDYWIVNLADRLLEVYRDPLADGAAPHGGRYRSGARLATPDRVALAGVPAVHLAVSDLLP